jgi:hypothetical protein
MIFSGNISRPLYPTTGGLSWVVSMDSTQRDNDFSWSFFGNNGKSLEYSFSGGEVVFSGDSYGGFDYLNNISTISGNATSGRSDLFLDSVPVFLGKQINFDYSTGVNLFSTGYTDIGFLVNSKPPEYSYTDSDYFYSGEPVEIKVINDSTSPFTVFSGRSSNNNWNFIGPEDLIVSPQSTGSVYFSLTSEFQFSSQFSVELFTDFGRAFFDFNADFRENPSSLFFIRLSPAITQLANGREIPLTNTFYNSLSGSNLKYTFGYYSGITGDFSGLRGVVNSSGNFPVSGIIQGQGFLTGYSTGIISRFNPLNNQTETGFGSGIMSEFKIASGDFFKEYLFDVQVLGSGNIRAMVPASGWRTGISASGFVSRANRFLEVSGVTGNMTGRGDLLEIQVSEGGEITRIYEQFFNTGSGVGQIYADINYNQIPVYYDFAQAGEIIERQIPSGIFYGTGTFTKFLVLTGAAPATGGRISGRVIGDFSRNYEPGLWTFSRWGRYIGRIGQVGPDGGTEGQPEQITGFEPVGLKKKFINVSGFLEGMATGEFLALGCDFDVPTLSISGRPVGGIYIDKEGDPVVIYNSISPQVEKTLSGEHWVVDNSEFLINSGDFLGETPWEKIVEDVDDEGNITQTVHTGILNIIDSEFYLNENGGTPEGGRIRISRLGDTPSGSGWFMNPVTTPEMGKNPLSSGAPSNTLAGWKETFQVEEGIFESNENDPDVSFLVSDLVFENSGDVSYCDFTVDEPGENLVSLELGEFEGFFNSRLCVDIFQTGNFCSSGQNSFTKISEEVYDFPVGVFYLEQGEPFINTISHVSGNISPNSSIPQLFKDKEFFDLNCSGSGCTDTGNYLFSFKSGRVYNDSFSNSITSGFYSGRVDRRYFFSRPCSFSFLASGLIQERLDSLVSGGAPFGISGSERFSWDGLLDFDSPDLRFLSFQCSGSGCTGAGTYSGLRTIGRFGGGVEKALYSGVSFAIDSRGARFSIGEYQEIEKWIEVSNSVFQGNVAANISEYVNGLPPDFLINFPDLYFSGSSNVPLNIPTGQNGDFWFLTGNCNGACQQNSFGSFTGNLSGHYSGRNGFFVVSGGKFSGSSLANQFIQGSSSGDIFSRDCLNYFESGSLIDRSCSDCPDYSSFSSRQQRPNLFFEERFFLDQGDYTSLLYFSECSRTGLLLNSFGFSHPQYIFCEKDLNGAVEIRKTGSFFASGVISIYKHGRDHVESYELMPSGYSTKYPFRMSQDQSSLIIPFPLENEGDIEDYEYFGLRIDNVVFSGNQLPVISNRLNAVVRVDDDNNPAHPLPCIPTILPPDPNSFGCCFINRVCYNMTPENCRLLGGSFNSVRTRCFDSNTCVQNDPPPPLPFGACCVDETSCSYVREDVCESQNGEFYPNTSCFSIDCSDPIGCCCNSSLGFGFLSSESNCLYNWLGGGVVCQGNCVPPPSPLPTPDPDAGPDADPDADPDAVPSPDPDTGPNSGPGGPGGPPSDRNSPVACTCIDPNAVVEINLDESVAPVTFCELGTSPTKDGEGKDSCCCIPGNCQKSYYTKVRLKITASPSCSCRDDWSITVNFPNSNILGRTFTQKTNQPYTVDHIIEYTCQEDFVPLATNDAYIETRGSMNVWARPKAGIGETEAPKSIRRLSKFHSNEVAFIKKEKAKIYCDTEQSVSCCMYPAEMATIIEGDGERDFPETLKVSWAEEVTKDPWIGQLGELANDLTVSRGFGNVGYTCRQPFKVDWSSGSNSVYILPYSSEATNGAWIWILYSPSNVFARPIGRCLITHYDSD